MRSTGLTVVSSNYGHVSRIVPPEKLGWLDTLTDTLRLCAPLTPSRNVLDRWKASKNYSSIMKFRKATLDHLKTQAICAFGHHGYPRPWAEKIDVHIIRCSNTKRHIDHDNILGGCKITLDCLQIKFGGHKTWYDGVGLIENDSHEHMTVTMVESRVRGHYGGLDVGTWLYIKRII